MDYSKIKHVDCIELSGSMYGKLLDKALCELDRSILYKSEQFHGEDHIMRTMANGAFVAKGEGYTEQETWLLMLCCSYHDIGRVNESKDDYHGPRAAKKIMSGAVSAFGTCTKEEMSIAAAAISVHSQNDSTASKYKDKYGITNDELYMKMIRGLKDADNMDRVRLKDLDVSHLRTDTAKNGVFFAMKVLTLIPPKMEPYWL